MNKHSKTHAGGAATGGGMNFQAAVTAISAVHLANGTPLEWLESLTSDTPIEISAETGGAGDDLRIKYQDNSIAEIQIKKGFHKGKALWEVLEKLAISINNNEINFGVLVVCPESSKSVTKELAYDIRRLGEGRNDNLKTITQTFIEKLKILKLPVTKTCKNIRIVTIHALDNDQASIVAVKAVLENVCFDKKQINAAWDRLYRDAGTIIENRSSRNASSILQLLKSANIQISDTQQTNPLSTLSELIKWTIKANEEFSIWGIQQKLSIEKNWVTIPIVVTNENTAHENINLTEALTKYHDWTKRDGSIRDGSISPITIGRFYRHVVIVSGPGMGKTTLLRRLALLYANEGFPVIKINLRIVAKRMKNKGESFKESLLELGLGNSGININNFNDANFTDVVLLCDGLDECGNDQKTISEALTQFAAGHSKYRIIVTTRPIGYDSSILSNWRHYEILPLPNNSISKKLSILIENIIGKDDPRAKTAQEYAASYFNKNPVDNLIARSPLLLCLVASLSIKGVTFNQSKSRLYAEIFKLFDNEPHDRINSTFVNKVVMHRLLDILAFELIKSPAISIDDLSKLCSKRLSEELSCNLLQASQEVENGIDYWQKVGVIEKIRHFQEETITFIHLTFAEYAAARYLSILPDTNLNDLLPQLIGLPSFAETISFASEMNIAKQICLTFLTNKAINLTHQGIIETCLKMVALSEPPLPTELVSKILDDAFLIVQSDKRNEALKIGDILGPIAIRFPLIIGPRVQNHFRHEHLWTRLIVWYCAINSGPEYYDFQELSKALIELPSLVEPLKRSLAGGLMMNDNGAGLLSTFICQATEILLRQLPDERSTPILKEALKDSNHFSFNTISGLEHIFKKLNKTHIQKQIIALDIFKNKNWFKKIEKSEIAYNTAFIKIFKILSEGHQIYFENPPGFLYNLAAFLEITAFWATSASDARAWSYDDQLDAAHEVFNALISASDICRISLANEAKIYLSSQDNDSGFSLSKLSTLAPSIDIPDPKWETKEFEFDVKKIEEACYHRSTWVANIAVHILCNSQNKNERIEISIRLMNEGRDFTLRAAAYIIESIGVPELSQDIIERLKLPFATGCEYLIDLLIDNPPIWDENIFEILESGLLSEYSDIAVSAAKLANTYSSKQKSDLYDLLQKSYTYWLEHEEPYPTEGGTVPTSPRKEILFGIMNIQQSEYSKLLEYSNDTRPDVRGVAEIAIIKKLHEDPETKKLFVTDILSRKISPKLIAAAFEKKMKFEPNQCEKLKVLLSSEIVEIRYAALGLLDTKYMTQAEIINLAQSIKNDSEQQIQDIAQSILTKYDT